MKKKLICLLLLGFFLMPFNVLAYTVTEAKEIYEKISTTTDEEGNSTLILNSLSPSDLVTDGACSFTKEKIEAECEDCYTDYTAEDWENIIEERTASCTNNLITAAVEMHMIDAGISMSDEIQI